MKMSKESLLFFIFFMVVATLCMAQSLEINCGEEGKKVVALIDLKEKGQLLVTQKDNLNQLYILYFDNDLELKWEAEYPFEDGNGPKTANYFTFLNNSKTLYIVNQNKINMIGEVDLESGEIIFEQPVSGSSELRRGEYFMSNETLIQANIEGSILKIQKIRDHTLIPIAEIHPHSHDEAVKSTSLQIIKIERDTITAYQTLPEPNHRKLRIFIYRYTIKGKWIDSACSVLALNKHTFAFNSYNDLNCQFAFDYNNRIHMFGNLAPRLSDNFGQFPSSNESRGLWWVAFDQKFHVKKFNYYPFTVLYQRNDEIVYGQPKYWGVKADGDSGFYLNMNLIPGGIYTGNLTFYLNRFGIMKVFSNTDNKENFMRYSMIYSRQYIKNSDVLVTNDAWNFYSTHHYSKMAYYPAFHSAYTKAIVAKANRYPDDAQKSELAYTILYKKDFAIIAEYYYKKSKKVKFEIYRP